MGGKGIVISLLRSYKRWISPLLPAACRFEPSCSDYAREAVEIHGVWRGGLLGLWRILRCQPFSRGGFDPVPGASSGPEHRTERRDVCSAAAGARMSRRFHG